MQLTRVPRGDLIPGKEIEGAAWLGMRANQNKIFAHDGEVISGLVGPFSTLSTTVTTVNRSGRNLDTWNPTLRMTRRLSTGAAFTLSAFGSRFYLSMVVRRVLPASAPILGTYTLTREATTDGWSSVSFVIPSVVEGDILSFSAGARREGASGFAGIGQFFLREKIATEAEIP